jgi:hypothetical protein
MPVNKLEHFDRAETYLKNKYRQIYSDWIQVNALVAQYNELAPKRNDLMIKLLRSQMKTAYPTLIESTPNIENNYYYLPLLISAFQSVADPFDDEWKVRLYEYPHNKQDGRPSTLKSQSQTLISSDEVSDIRKEKLEGIFDKVKGDPQYVRMSDNLVEFDTQANERLNDFVTKLRDLCDKIDFQEV